MVNTVLNAIFAENIRKQIMLFGRRKKTIRGVRMLTIGIRDRVFSPQETELELRFISTPIHSSWGFFPGHLLGLMTSRVSAPINDSAGLFQLLVFVTIFTLKLIDLSRLCLNSKTPIYVFSNLILSTSLLKTSTVDYSRKASEREMWIFLWSVMCKV